MKQLLTILKYALLLSLSGLLMWYAVRGQDLSRIGEYVREGQLFLAAGYDGFVGAGLLEPSVSVENAAGPYRLQSLLLGRVPCHDGGLPGQL